MITVRNQKTRLTLRMLRTKMCPGTHGGPAGMPGSLVFTGVLGAARHFVRLPSLNLLIFETIFFLSLEFLSISSLAVIPFDPVQKKKQGFARMLSSPEQRR